MTSHVNVPVFLHFADRDRLSINFNSTIFFHHRGLSTGNSPGADCGLSVGCLIDGMDSRVGLFSVIISRLRNDRARGAWTYQWVLIWSLGLASGFFNYHKRMSYGWYIVRNRGNWIQGFFLIYHIESYGQIFTFGGNAWQIKSKPKQSTQ